MNITLTSNRWMLHVNVLKGTKWFLLSVLFRTILLKRVSSAETLYYSIIPKVIIFLRNFRLKSHSSILNNECLRNVKKLLPGPIYAFNEIAYYIMQFYECQAITIHSNASEISISYGWQIRLQNFWDKGNCCLYINAWIAEVIFMTGLKNPFYPGM